jgi:hypothetical protein
MIKYWVMFVVWSTVVIYGLIGMGAAFVAKGLGSHILEVSVLLRTAWTLIIVNVSFILNTLYCWCRPV